VASPSAWSKGWACCRATVVAEDVKALDQDSRAVLRKHGVRFGQFTIFLPLLLKPAPTRLRLVLWSLAKACRTPSPKARRPVW
jgi:ATP-dependent RNA helicase SUPV3L1/SUV3